MYQNTQNTRRERPLTLPEELERLEQQITLTYQEIDRNFDRAHRIVTGQILPIVEKYRKESKNLWDNSEFWKTFFEASAGVKFDLTPNGQPTDETTMEQTEMEDTEYTEAPDQTHSMMDETSHDDTTRMEEETERPQTVRVRADDDTTMHVDDSLLDSIDMSSAEPAQSTPKQQTTRGGKSIWAKMDSPYNRLRKELEDSKNESSSNFLPAPTTTIKLDYTDDSLVPLSSPLSIRRKPPTSTRQTRSKSAPQRSPSPDSDILSLDSSPFQAPPTTTIPLTDYPKNPTTVTQSTKNWRIQATPLAKTPSRYNRRGTSAAPTPRRLFTGGPNDTNESTTFNSSPFAANPPKHNYPATPSRKTPNRRQQSARGERSVKLPPGVYESDSDEDSFLGMSPPVTVAFSLPQRKLLATPAREASRRIVNDILETAGAKEEESTMTTPIMMSARRKGPVVKEEVDETMETTFETRDGTRDEDDIFS
ncbi:hypothetical protein BJ508DRAFT_373112 [Ascobolus immersus RN42]|uniref:DASH complex subunit ASK1 n=1 Tax=Ascobolus immersus RN42 TaxID=1160509 RepID=A0A3N4INW3_ASCIM|nr:hypothetical protein BJ508DRAFT_373112 [Ascobolus immersus RN42]